MALTLALAPRTRPCGRCLRIAHTGPLFGTWHLTKSLTLDLWRRAGDSVENAVMLWSMSPRTNGPALTHRILVLDGTLVGARWVLENRSSRMNSWRLEHIAVHPLRGVRTRPGRTGRSRHSGGWRLATCLLLLVALSSGEASETGPWLLVDTEALTLTVMQGGQPQMTLENIAIGRYGASAEKRRGDNMTPRGRFRVHRINRDSEFYRFIGLDYPDIQRARQAYQAGDIGGRELQAILGAHDRGAAPPQGTVLGGNIGIHGLGEGDPQLHETMNWTRGCVALTDEQIDALLSWVRIGMTVEIR